MSKIVIIVRNKPRISLISLVISTIISPYFLQKRKLLASFVGSLFSGRGGFGNTCEILSLLSEG